MDDTRRETNCFPMNGQARVMERVETRAQVCPGERLLNLKSDSPAPPIH